MNRGRGKPGIAGLGPGRRAALAEALRHERRVNAAARWRTSSPDRWGPVRTWLCADPGFGGRRATIIRCVIEPSWIDAPRHPDGGYWDGGVAGYLTPAQAAKHKLKFPAPGQVIEIHVEL